LRTTAEIGIANTPEILRVFESSFVLDRASFRSLITAPLAPREMQHMPRHGAALQSEMLRSLEPRGIIRLLQTPAADLPALERGLIPPSLAARTFADALAPPHVARRIQQHLAAGKPAHWVGTFYIFDANDCCVGGCGFKDVPRAREVEVGYGIAAARRCRGYASAALQQLVRIAADSGEVDVVVALIASDNLASMRVAGRAGFVAGNPVLDEGAWLLRWRRALTPRVRRGLAH
jgi:ribosomal-protein-alanine N-acetyltransferase